MAAFACCHCEEREARRGNPFLRRKGEWEKDDIGLEYIKELMRATNGRPYIQY